MRKKAILSFSIIAILVTSLSIGSISLYILLNEHSPVTLIYGIEHGPYDLDPHMAYDYTSIKTIDQVCEGLYGYEVDDSKIKIIPKLASANGSWNGNKTEYTVPLRTDVYFHDGEKFNADAVKFNFERIEYFINVTGNSTLETPQVGVYFYKNKPIINRTEVISEYIIKFVLNNQFAAFRQLLCFTYILSPKSTPKMDIIKPETGKLVGTGPFIYEKHELGVEILFTANQRYWKGRPRIDNLVYSILPDANARNVALLSNDVHLITEVAGMMVEIFNYTKDIDLIDESQDLIINYLGMNNIRINLTMRKAISFAIDYDYLITEILRDHAKRLKSPIPEGIIYANWSFEVPVLNLSKARQLLKDVNWDGVAGSLNVSRDTDWTFLVDSGNPLATYNFTFNQDSEIRADIAILLRNNLKKIGVRLTLTPLNLYEFLKMLFELENYHRNMLELYSTGWGPDYYDPRGFINPLFTNRSIEANSAQVNDPQIQIWMEQADDEIDPNKREKLFDMIQQRLIEEIFPWAWLYVETKYIAKAQNLEGVSSIPGGILNFHSSYFTS